MGVMPGPARLPGVAQIKLAGLLSRSVLDLAPWKEVLILPDGSVSPCLDFVAGNLKEEGFLSIWNGPRFVQFRRKLKQMGKFPICNRCCILYRN